MACCHRRSAGRLRSAVARAVPATPGVPTVQGAPAVPVALGEPVVQGAPVVPVALGEPVAEEEGAVVAAAARR